MQAKLSLFPCMHVRTSTDICMIDGCTYVTALYKAERGGAISYTFLYTRDFLVFENQRSGGKPER